jgi:excisionase family DNA binding protein
MSQARQKIQPYIPKPIESDLAPRSRTAGQQWWSMRQVGERLGLSEETIRKRIRRGTIRAQKFGRSVRISEVEAQRLESTGWE